MATRVGADAYVCDDTREVKHQGALERASRSPGAPPVGDVDVRRAVGVAAVHYGAHALAVGAQPAGGALAA